MAKTVCIVGAGVAGLSAVKSCIEEGLQPTCYELRSDLGGLWNYMKSERTNRARAYESLITNVSKEASCFSDFPYPEDYSPFVGHKEVLEYLRNYATYFDLDKYITCNIAVENLEQTKENREGGRTWKVTLRDLEAQQTKIKYFDCVMICSGRDSSPKMPSNETFTDGTFDGKVMHSCEYDSPEEFQGKNVVVVGLGNSGADIAVDVSRYANLTLLSSRSGAWIIPRNFEDGLPPDMTATTRLKSFIRGALPEFIGSWSLSNLLNSRVNHDTLGLRSRYGPMNPTASFLVNDELPARIFSGKIEVKPGVKRLNKNKIYFTDGSKAKVDVVICATGYGTKFPFISNHILPDDKSKLRLFQWMVPFEIERPESLAVIGLLPFTGGSSFPDFECQTRYIAAVMSGASKLPPVSEMKESFEKMRSKFHGDGEDFSFRSKLGFAYPDELAKLGGFYPSFWQLLFRDPRLAFAVHVGPFMSYHYRLVGRHTWSGARERILNAIPNTLAGLRSIYEGDMRNRELL